MEKVVNNCSIYQYADDTCLIAANKDVSEAESQLQLDFDNFCKWSHDMGDSAHFASSGVGGRRFLSPHVAGGHLRGHLWTSLPMQQYYAALLSDCVRGRNTSARSPVDPSPMHQLYADVLPDCVRGHRKEGKAHYPPTHQMVSGHRDLLGQWTFARPPVDRLPNAPSLRRCDIRLCHTKAFCAIRRADGSSDIPQSLLTTPKEIKGRLYLQNKLRSAMAQVVSTFGCDLKKGRCPEYPHGVWVCTHSCTGDSDCPRTLKCCPNRCGALTCQRPESDEVPAPAA
ncbi:unnamed protein product [Chilo suppressalis]|uniref:WAP domain-containing protein n=1 Tax=Chilo suppressalis TaxID=168631 RepID=A0ABN8BHP3_CHISP|nr:unnamed protein product [Chilo suppressalis]